MGIWKEIKYAINSTLGTRYFKSLDQIIYEKSKLVVSDEVYETLKNVQIELNDTRTHTVLYPSKLIMKRYGELKLSGELQRSSYAYVSAGITIYKNSEEVYSYSVEINSGDNIEPFSTIIAVEPHDEIVISFNGRTNGTIPRTAMLQNIAIYGTLKETAYLTEPIEEE